MRDHYMPASFLAIACLAVAVSTTYAVASKRPNPVTIEHISIDTENVVFAAPESAYAESEPEPVVMPETVITAHRDPLAGPGKRCSQGAWFGSRALEQGSGNVRGFCP